MDYNSIMHRLSRIEGALGPYVRHERDIGFRSSTTELETTAEGNQTFQVNFGPPEMTDANRQSAYDELLQFVHRLASMKDNLK